MWKDPKFHFTVEAVSCRKNLILAQNNLQKCRNLIPMQLNNLCSLPGCQALATEIFSSAVSTEAGAHMD